MNKAEASLKGRDILDLASLTLKERELILETAGKMKDILNRDMKKEPLLRGKSIITLFYEASTRTRTSFELAGKYLGADVVNIAVASSSVSKGESLRDTLYTLQAMKTDAIIMRHPVEGAADYAAKALDAVVINAGDGQRAHPTQALLDLFTIKRHKKNFSDLKIAILGDIRHSRVARSNIVGFREFGAEVRIAGPRPLIPAEIEKLGVVVCDRIEDAIAEADVIYVLRIQLERQKVGFFPTTREYSRIFGLKERHLKLAKPDVLVMHPGPVNRGLEISPDVMYGDKSLIEEQVENGVAVRMAILYLTLTDGEHLEFAN
ncbi:MAG: aspartate carbamoyltransferase catalytic subunit [Holosporaceae bacterium]|jgi:aspartate carbamoyltransferase catalytic subunit|nr:aspartate carbamoyltransferase catalytic subunit [Holosporaceae bacterium]